jgi:hypothetical protein
MTIWTIRVRQNNSTGKSPKSLSSPSRKNIPLNVRRKSVLYSARLTADEGRVAIVTNVAVGCGGRESYETTSVAIADGEVVWSWRPDAGAK